MEESFTRLHIQQLQRELEPWLEPIQSAISAIELRHTLSIHMDIARPTARYCKYTVTVIRPPSLQTYTRVYGSSFTDK